jgi:anti-anti-sigma factor
MLHDNLLTVQCEVVDGIGVLRLDGEFVAETRYEPERVLREWLEQGVRRVIVHCDKIRRIDSAGSSVLLGALHKFRRQDGDLLLVQLSQDLNAFFEMTSLQQYFKIFDDAKEARKHCLRHAEPSPKPKAKKRRGRRPAASREAS